MHWFVDRFDKRIAFANIVDKGYRCIMIDWRAGKQLFLQPAFALSDRKFYSREVSRSSMVTSNRSDNERAANVAKCPGVLKRGLLRPNAESPQCHCRRLACLGMSGQFQDKPAHKLGYSQARFE
jgi:hypothetical protein